jgi:hypothetical protein
MSLSLLASSSFLKSLVFCARSFLCVSVSLWCATMSDATLSSCGMRVVRSMAGAWLAAWCNGCAEVSYFSTLLWPSGTCSLRLRRLAPRQCALHCPARSPESSSPPCLRRRPLLLVNWKCSAREIQATGSVSAPPMFVCVSPQLPRKRVEVHGFGVRLRMQPAFTQVAARECCGAPHRSGTAS